MSKLYEVVGGIIEKTEIRDPVKISQMLSFGGFIVNPTEVDDVIDVYELYEIMNNRPEVYFN